MGDFPSGSAVVNPLANAEDIGDSVQSWVRKIPWRREWQATPVFFPEECHGQGSLTGCSPWGHKESNAIEHACKATTIYKINNL